MNKEFSTTNKDWVIFAGQHGEPRIFLIPTFELGIDAGCKRVAVLFLGLELGVCWSSNK